MGRRVSEANVPIASRTQLALTARVDAWSPTLHASNVESDDPARVEPVDEEAFEGRRALVRVGVDPPVEADALAEHGVMRAGQLAERYDDRQAHRDEDAGEHVEDHHAERRGDGQEQLGSAEPGQRGEPGEVDDGDRRGDDHRSQGGLGDLGEHRTQQQQGGGEERRPDDTDELGVAAERGWHGGAAGARGDREALGESGGDVDRAERGELLVGIDAVVQPAGDRPTGQDVVGVADQGDAEGDGQQLAEVAAGDVGPCQAWQAGRDVPDDGDAVLVEVEQRARWSLRR